MFNAENKEHANLTIMIIIHINVYVLMIFSEITVHIQRENYKF